MFFFGFVDVCLNRYVLEIVFLGLKIRVGKLYRVIYD